MRLDSNFSTHRVQTSRAPHHIPGYLTRASSKYALYNARVIVIICRYTTSRHYCTTDEGFPYINIVNNDFPRSRPTSSSYIVLSHNNRPWVHSGRSLRDCTLHFFFSSDQILYFYSDILILLYNIVSTKKEIIERLHSWTISRFRSCIII